MLHTKEDCIFCKIVSGEIPSKKVLENENFLSFYDLNPVAKIHVLIIPKNHVDNIASLDASNETFISGILVFAKEVAKTLGIAEDGYRLIFNTGEKAGQTVFHMHAHLLGGEELSWPGA